MKKLSLLLCALLCTLAGQATHLMGGDVTVYRDSATQKYFVKVVHYRDTAGIPAYPTASCQLFSYDAVTGTYNQVISFVAMMDASQSGSAIPNFPYGVEVYTYRDSIPASLTPGAYRLVATECCRNAAIQNLTNPLSESMSLVADFKVPPTGSNTTPQFLAMPIVYLPVNQPWTYNPLPYDVDGDSISWAVDTAYDIVGSNGTLFNVNGYNTPPSATSGPFTLNAISGQLSWTPMMMGNFVASFAITEYKNGVAAGTINRDMQYVVVDSLAPTPQFSFVTSTPYQWDAAGQYAYIYYTPGQPLQFKIKGSDNGSVQMLMECISSLFMRTPAPSFATMLTGSGNQIEGTLNWTPLANETGNKTVVFRLKNGVFTKDFTLMLKKNPAPASVTSASASVGDFQVFPNPAGRVLNLSLNNQQAQDLSINLVDMTGKTVAALFRGTLQKGVWTMTETLRCAPGLYLVQVRCDGKLMTSEKLIVE